MFCIVSKNSGSVTFRSVGVFGRWGLPVLVAALLTCSVALCYLDRHTSPASTALIGSHSYPADSGASGEPSQGAGYTATLFVIFFGMLLSVMFVKGRNLQTTMLRRLTAGARETRLHFPPGPWRALFQVFLL